MGSLLLKLLTGPQGIEEVGLGRYLARFLKHLDGAPNTRNMFVKIANSLINCMVCVRSRFIGQFGANKLKNLSKSREICVLHLPAHTVPGLSGLIYLVNLHLSCSK